MARQNTKLVFQIVLILRTLLVCVATPRTYIQYLLRLHDTMNESPYFSQFSLSFLSTSEAKETMTRVPSMLWSSVEITSDPQRIKSSCAFLKESGYPTIIAIAPDNSTGFWYLLNLTIACTSRSMHPSRNVWMLFWPGMATNLVTLSKVQHSAAQHISCPSYFHVFLSGIQLLFIVPVTRAGHLFFEVFEIFCIKNIVVASTVENPMYIVPFELNRSDLRGVTVRHLVKRYHVEYGELSWVNGSVELTSGIIFQAVSNFAYSMNFRLETVIGQLWTEQLPNGSLIGLGGQLLAGEADVVLAESEFLPYRAEMLSVGLATLRLSLAVYLKVPHATTLTNIFFQPFDNRVWAAILIFLACIHLIYAFGSHLERRIINFKGLKIGKSDGIENALLMISVVSQQGCVQINGRMPLLDTENKNGWHAVPKSFPLRIILFCGISSSFVVYTIFGSSIYSAFSVYVNILKTLQDLPKHGIRIYALNVSESSAYVVQRTAITYGRTYSNDITVNLSDAIELINSSKSAVVAGDTQMFWNVQMNRNLTEGEYCSWKSEIHIPGATYLAGLLFRKGDPLSSVFRYKMTAWFERGFRYKHQQDFVRLTAPRCEKQRQGLRSLFLDDVRTGFHIFAIGTVSALIIFIGEVMTNGPGRKPGERQEVSTELT